MKSSMLSERLRILVDAYCTDGIEESEVRELEALLRGDAQARRYFSAYCRMHAELFFAAKAEHAIHAVQEMLRPMPATSPTVSLLGNAWGGAVHYFSQVGPLSYLIATVLFGLGLLVGSWVTVGESHRQTQPVSIAQQQRSPRSTTVSKPAGPKVARITGLLDCRWIDPATQVAEHDPVTMGEKYTLAAGLMEITYETGAKVILQGPCSYSVDSVRGGFLSLGRLTARVEKEAASDQRPPTRNPLFAVRTPTATVTDLGTEFGVEVSAEGRTDARVFEGSVRVAADGDKHNKKSGDKKSGDRQRVCRKGETVRVEPNGSAVRPISGKDADDHGYVRVMPAVRARTEQQNTQQNTYAKLVLSLDPLFYYRMEKPKSERVRQIVFDSAPGGHHGELHTDNPLAGSSYRAGRFGDSLDFRACGGVNVLNYPAPTKDRLAVSVWVMTVGRPSKIAIAGNRGVPQGMEFAFGLLYGDGELGAAVTRSDGKTLRVREGATLPTGEWHHVAMTTDGATLHLYRNGKEVVSAAFDAQAGQKPIVGTNGKSDKIDKRNIMRAGDVASSDRSEVRVDELIVFDRAISPEVIERLFRGGPRQDQTPETTRPKGERR